MKKINLLTLFVGLCVVSSGLAQENMTSGSELTVLYLTDAHRDAVKNADERIKFVVVGEREKQFLVDPQGAFWNDYIARGRFNEESCAQTNRPFTSIAQPHVEIRGVKEGDVIEQLFHVLETPGMSRNSVSYWRGNGNDESVLVMTGNLIHADGKIANLYDLQDNFPEADIGPYHGFMARAPKLIASLEKIRALKPNTLITHLGQKIENPEQSIDTLIKRLRAVYRNYLSTSALWWYFGEKRMNASALAILGDDFDPAKLDRMPEAKKHENPDWLIGFSTTRMIRSETGNVFVMDVSGNDVADRIINMHANGDFKTVDGMFVTHYHHDHNAGVPKVAEYFSAPVYGVEPLADILERPGAYRMPCIQNITVPIVRKKDGETMRWHEFEFTFFDFPGQTLYHNALLVRKGTERPIFFIGDSFTPTGIDDYCAWNRNLLKEGKGYLYCLEKIRSLEPSPLLVNAHVDPPFELDAARLDYIERALRERMKLLADLLAVPEINFGIDHAWCRFDPFVATLPEGESISIKVIITNHFDHACKFRVEIEPDDVSSFQIMPELVQDVTLAPGKEQSIQWSIRAASERTQTGFLSAKVTADGLTGHCEAVILRDGHGEDR
ncbi:MAG: MBL fold metallo-hydrolase [Planctomycetaceae bacterium]|nr:MBL fold metallo-hydrolase [Planctomycetaceae bacterium]